MENKYQRGKIYKIISNHTDKIYIGSTTEPTLARRLTGHTRDYKYHLVGKFPFVSSFELLQYPDYKIVLIEFFPCNSKDELLAREQHRIDLAREICVNRQKAFTGLTVQEYQMQYRAENKEILAEMNKQYRAENKEILAEKHKQYRAENKEMLLEHKKQYYVENREVLIEKHKQYNTENREIILEKRKQKIECECGTVFSKSHKARHERSFIHTEYLKMLA